MSPRLRGRCLPSLRAAFRNAIPRCRSCSRGWLIAMHYVDVFWLVVPSVQPSWSWMNLVWGAGAILFVAGATATLAVWRCRRAARVAVHDPLLEWSVGYQAH